MTVKPLKSTTSYCGGSREREVFRNAIFEGETFICEVRTPYLNKLQLLTETILQTLENGLQGKVRIEDAEPSTLR